MKSPGQSVQTEDGSGAAIAARENTVFALDLYRILATESGNLCVSPYSISTALAMTYAGARGETERQMAQAMHFTLDQARLHPAFAELEAGLRASQDKGDVLLQVANKLWPQVGYPFLEAFLALTRAYYGVSITPIDYGDPEAARLAINAWVEEKTREKIKDLIPPGILSPMTTMVLVNAIYFKGNWAHQFDPQWTEPAPFWKTPADKVEVPMMKQTAHFGYGESAGCQILELPYVGEDLAMTLLLPAEPGGLAALEAALTVEDLARWTSSLWEAEVEVYLPRFKVRGAFELGRALMSLGMPDAFGARADFSGMDGTRSLFISAVLHQAFVEVNEEGAEAAAATAVVMARGLPMAPPVFRADHPFLFLLRDRRTGGILFMGRVADPA
jgi:serine protease inhibitor